MNLNELELDKLDQEERDLLESFENGEWQSVGTLKRFEEIRLAAHATLAEEKQVTLKLSSLDWDILQSKATEEGIADQTLIASIVHKYLTGKLIERTNSTGVL